ncbi:MAG: N-acetylmuramoyl-L-alanine amidase, partial [Clostridia bacterium]|nr:N-acetylmuramoyl-L-alanine amidase [Clostridia bacterium]
KTGSERGTITAATFNYIDITFCYSSKFDIDLKELEKSPLFSRAQLIKNTADYTLRLYLKATGAFYGWTADYNSSGELVFKFLNPKKATVADNKYGGRLDGIKIVVDPGHGGSDPGAVGNVSNKELTEANRSLFLSEMLKTRLEELGATVIMTRTTDTSLTSDERILTVRNNNPDLAVSVHRNAANSASANGFSAHYFNPFTKAVADKIKDATAKTDAYKKSQTKWHVFYMSRISNCPVVLTENGFMSNSEDFGNMKSKAWNEKCADAIVKGIVDYFLSL